MVLAPCSWEFAVKGAPPCPWATGTSCHGSTSRPRDLGFTLPASRQPERVCGLWAPAPARLHRFSYSIRVTLRGRHKCTATSRAPRGRACPSVTSKFCQRPGGGVLVLFSCPWVEGGKEGGKEPAVMTWSCQLPTSMDRVYEQEQEQEQYGCHRGRRLFATSTRHVSGQHHGSVHIWLADVSRTCISRDKRDKTRKKGHPWTITGTRTIMLHRSSAGTGHLLLCKTCRLSC